MKKLLEFLISSITGSDKFSVTKESNEAQDNYVVKADPEIIGLIIGKDGKTIKNIRRIMSIKATLDDKMVNVSVSD
ncbi:MAG: hypothetical protein UV74_C0013G0171 [Candidatus Woesebacteria bacterium GW2011_GWB1_43_14]|uniref:Uncharacterized protein n=1 Tax=Candidatus Woesebacteria bacterium GW2011_GWB1_43_14 TaxID=1618578 RepID=A0A0G1DH64_9BACT|nr:MAG: hypothetical protein UV51_C0005G0049 [Candidatus Woesebacteria bacterium GW2011_GWC1_42_9]KKS97049.1 MAG: hypothetical protein UV74_C0013G0171 [Candidatus Woesebacteria bacterium GW2011_GWB1_43_14]